MTRRRRTDRPPIGILVLAVIATIFFALPFVGLL